MPTPEQIQQDKAARRAALRTEYWRTMTNPHAHLHGESGGVVSGSNACLACYVIVSIPLLLTKTTPMVPFLCSTIWVWPGSKPCAWATLSTLSPPDGRSRLVCWRWCFRLWAMPGCWSGNVTPGKRSTVPVRLPTRIVASSLSKRPAVALFDYLLWKCVESKKGAVSDKQNQHQQ